VTTLSGQPLYSEFFELRPKPSSVSPLHRCRLESTADAPPSPPGLPDTRLLHRADCVYGGHVAAGGRGGFAATMAATGRSTCRHHYRAVSPRRAVSSDRLLAGKDAAVELVASSQGHGGGAGDEAASPDLLPGSDLESLVNTSTH